ncbi:ArnT family glycosyltransferase [Desulfovibrio litoralis]|uniref:4-amino-4-deoxy-L-arabinose transferase n=1 Tax=Desulfovibrio litoralis DSM 11393 TaxID=1121455 RepID=A0A1M7RVT2_9BACT|nr:glycosyltransferase family 39 protein [Desulfovibrio litoralis]SHN50218.1 4-amino-4-deoxy-L-arabinose transferase [Desulfovibrio litoralis DSM 11393]
MDNKNENIESTLLTNEEGQNNEVTKETEPVIEPNHNTEDKQAESFEIKNTSLSSGESETSGENQELSPNEQTPQELGNVSLPNVSLPNVSFSAENLSTDQELITTSFETQKQDSIQDITPENITEIQSDNTEPTTNPTQTINKAFKITADNASSPTIISRIFNILAFMPLLTLSILYIAQTFFLIDNHELWYSDEVRHGDVLRYLLESKDWFVLHLNGEFYPDKPPLYFLFLVGLKYILVFLDQTLAPTLTSLTGFNISFLNQERIVPQLMSLGASISGLFFLWSSYFFAKLVGRFDRRLSFATGLVLLSSIYFMGTTHYARMDLFFGSLIIISQIFLFKAVQKDKSFPLMISAFVFMGLATLTKGPLGFAFPLLSVIVYLLWQKRLRRLIASDFFIALGVGIAVTLSWFVILILRFDFNYVYSSIVDRQVIQRGLDAWHHKKAWYMYIWLLPLIYLPFSLLLPLANFKNLKQRILSSREPEYQGLSYIWIFALTGFILLSLISTKIHIYLLPLFAPLAAISAKQILSFSERKSLYFRYILAIFATLLILIGGLPLVAPYILPDFYANEDVRILGTIFIAGIAVVFSAIFWAGIKERRPEALLLTFAIFICLLMQPIFLITAPSMNNILSPHAQALVLKEYKAKGYTPASYRVYKGIYSFYLEDKLIELDTAQVLDKLINSNEKVILAIKAKDYNEFTPEQIEKLQKENKHNVIEEKQRLLEILKPLKKIGQQRIAEELIFLLATDNQSEQPKTESEIKELVPNDNQTTDTQPTVIPDLNTNNTSTNATITGSTINSITGSITGSTTGSTTSSTITVTNSTRLFPSELNATSKKQTNATDTNKPTNSPQE